MPYFKATPHNPRLKPLHVIYLHIIRHSTQILLAGRQPACVEFMHSDEKSDFVSDAQGLCGIALTISISVQRPEVLFAALIQSPKHLIIPLIDSFVCRIGTINGTDRYHSSGRLR